MSLRGVFLFGRACLLGMVFLAGIATHSAPAAAGTVRDLLFSVLDDEASLKVTPTGDARLVVKGARVGIAELRLTVNNPPQGWNGPSLNAIVRTPEITPRFYRNGIEVLP